MASMPTVRESEIERRVGQRNLQRGQEYFESGAVFNTRRQNHVLKASCTGSSSTPYRVQITFGNNGIMDAGCTCPVGADGRCKHVAATLICWGKHPDEFVAVEELDAGLDRCSRGELINLVGQLLRQRPDLEGMMESMLPSPGVPASVPNPKTYRHQVAALLHRAGDTPAHTRLIEQLLAIKEIGDAFARQRELGSAAVVYQAITEELLDQADALDERYVGLSDVLNECVEALGRCLAGKIEESDVRTSILRTLMDVYRFDLVFRGTARRDVPTLIINHATSKERRSVAEWIQQLLPSVDDRSTRRILGGLLLDLEAGRLDHQTFCGICRQTGRTLDLVRRLVQRGQIDEAAEEAEEADNYDLLKVADMLIRLRRTGLAERLVRERWEAGNDQALDAWIEKFQTDRQSQLTALELSEKVFRLQPSFDTYCQLRNLARELGRWDDVQPGLLAFLEEAGRMQLLVRIHLDENEIERALELAAGNGVASSGYGLELEVARAAERSRPQEALTIYRNHVQRLITRRGRENYTDACRYLRKVRTLMNRTGVARNWADYMSDLRHRHRTLRALLEELAAAKL